MACHLVFVWIALAAQFWGKVATATTSPLPLTNTKTTYLKCYLCDNSGEYKWIPPCIQGKNGTIMECNYDPPIPVDGPYCQTHIVNGTVTQRGCSYLDNPDHKLGCYEYVYSDPPFTRCLCNRCGHFLLM